MVPTVLRTKLLDLVHDLPSSAHLGVHKTKDRLSRHFFRPKLYKDVRDFYRICPTCVRVDKSNHPMLMMLQLVKRNWLKDYIDENLRSTNLIDFVLDFRDKIRISLEMANEIEDKAKKKSKFYYDARQQDSFNAGDQVLLLPLTGKPLQAKYCLYS